MKPYQLLTDWLTQISRENLVDTFFENGYFDLEQISLMSDEELVLIVGEKDQPLLRNAINKIPEYMAPSPKLAAEKEKQKRNSWDDSYGRS